MRKNSNSSVGSSGSNRQFNSNSPIQLAIRTELFDHGVYPQMHNQKISPTILIDTFTNLNLLSSIDYKIKLQNWVDQAVKHIPGMSESDATIYFMSYKTLLQDIDSQGSNSTGANDPNISIQQY